MAVSRWSNLILFLVFLLVITECLGAPTGNTTMSQPTGACKCGYSISRFNNMYVREGVNIDLKQSSASALSSAGVIISNGWQTGPTAPDGTKCMADPKNVHFTSEGLELVFPGGQAAGGQTTGAEVSYSNQGRGMTKTFIEAEMQMDKTAGTCQALFTFTTEQDKSKDEQDMEIIAASLMKKSSVAEAGLQLTNHDPAGSGEKGQKIVPFSSNPSVGFHKYSMAWDGKSVQYYYDDKALQGPTNYVSVNPSKVVLSHWGTGDLGFFGAPLPAATVTMKVKSLRIYYETAAFI